MRKRLFWVFIFLLSATLKISAQTGYSNLEFVENKGQWDKSVRYRAEISTGAFFLHKNGFTVMLQNPDDLKRERSHGNRNKTSTDLSKTPVTGKMISVPGVPSHIIHAHAYKVSFVEASDNVEITADKPLITYNNYFIGKDSTKWATGCKIFQGVTYKDIYPGIDARYYTDNGTLKYDLVVHPGADPNRIIMKYDGVEKLSIKNNRLLIKTSVGTARETTPSSFQLNKTGRAEVECSYFMAGNNTIRFKIRNYAPDQTLVIDPALVFSSFTGSPANNWGFTATYGPDGSFFAGGIASSAGYPTTSGAFQTDFAQGDWDVAIMKFSSDGSKRLYATYLGGDKNEYPHSMVADLQGNLVVFGRTTSGSAFPAMTQVGVGGGRDIFVTKFNATGTALIGSMLIGGSRDDGVNIEDQGEANDESTASLVQNYGDWSRGEVILDGSNNIYVASCTQSFKSDGTGFPIIGNVFQPKFGNATAVDTTHFNQDGVVIKINPACNAVIFSSFLGGTGDDAALVMDISPLTGDLYVGGATQSNNLPGTSAAVLQPATKGNIDGFLSQISADGTTLRHTTYLGTPGIDMVYGVKFDKFGFPYVMGTSSGSWPVINSPVGASMYVDKNAKQFVSKLKPDLSAMVFSTTFGTPGSPRPNISPVAFLVDRCENIYVSGWGSFYLLRTPDPYGLTGTTGMRITPDAIKKVTDGRDFYFMVLKRDAASLLYGTFFGQKDPPDNSTISEHVDGGTSRYDKSGVIYEAICANCGGNTTFPTTPGVWARTNGAIGVQGCNEAAVKIAFNFAGVSANPKALINGVLDSSGCVPLDVTLEDVLRNAKSYIWSFGDGSPDSTTTSYQLTHTYTAIGEYLVRLIAVDSTTCNIRDTAYIHIIARNDKALLGFNAVKLPPCESLSYQFNNSSTPPAGKPFNDSSFVWDFGDGTTVPSGPAGISHSYAAPGTFKVKLYLLDTNYCNFPDSSVLTLSVASLVKAQFTTPAAGCAPYTAQFTNTSAGGQQFLYDFGDGATSTDPNPTHLYSNTGTYTITLLVIDANTCNIRDSTATTITVSAKPQAAFSTTPDPPTPNTPTVFHNSSTGGVRYKWIFGDGDSVTTTTMDTIMHQYTSTGPFNACLVVFNQFECTDTACAPVQVIINPLLDVPNAFTPGRFGENAVIKVRGFGITHLVFRIYNRWGQQVFQSNDVNQGWDGTFKGSPQPMDVYAYVVEAAFFDGTKSAKKGDITLIR